MIQFGRFGDKTIRAFAVETDYSYRFHDVARKPQIGIKVDFIGGDRRQGDDRLNTFNSLFSNPSYFGLLAQLDPMNLFDMHPWVGLELNERTELTFDWDFFWRASKEDGLYAPSRILIRRGNENQARWVGHQPGIELVHRIDRHATWQMEASYFLPGAFLRDSGQSENLFHVATTLSYRF